MYNVILKDSDYSKWKKQAGKSIYKNVKWKVESSQLINVENRPNLRNCILNYILIASQPILMVENF